LALLLVFHQTHNLVRNKFARALANLPIRALYFFNQQQMFLLRIKFIMQGEKRETSTKTVARQVEGFCISYFAAFNRACVVFLAAILNAWSASSRPGTEITEIARSLLGTRLLP